VAANQNQNIDLISILDRPPERTKISVRPWRRNPMRGVKDASALVCRPATGVRRAAAGCTAAILLLQVTGPSQSTPPPSPARFSTQNIAPTDPTTTEVGHVQQPRRGDPYGWWEPPCESEQGAAARGSKA